MSAAKHPPLGLSEAKRSRRPPWMRLLVLAALAIAVLILARSFGGAAARLAAAQEPGATPASLPASQSAVAHPRSATPGVASADELGALATRLREREQELEKRLRAVEEREKQLQVLDGQIRKNLEEIGKIKDAIDAAIAKEKKREGERLRQLIDVYRKMRPANVAQALLDLYGQDEELALGLFGELTTRDLAKIMDIIVVSKPEVAARVGRELARGTFRCVGAAPTGGTSAATPAALPTAGGAGAAGGEETEEGQ